MPTHKWQFTSRFRYHAFGWNSKLPIQRIKEALSEIKSFTRKDPILAAEGAVMLLEKLSPALEQVDSSSGAIGTAVNRAIDTLVPIIAKADVDIKIRKRWLDRLWTAFQDDAIPYLECLGDYWGELCVTKEMASSWADELLPFLENNWSPASTGHCFFKGTSVCLSCLYSAGRYDELLTLVDKAPYRLWHDRQWGVKALVAMNKKAEAIRYAEDSRGRNEPDWLIAQTCEAILLSSGMTEEAYRRYAIEANQTTTNLATFRAIVKKYPRKPVEEILRDLIASTPGSEGKWFAAAKSAGLFNLAIELVTSSPTDPRTLIRAAQDFRNKNPAFAVESGLAALKWLSLGYGYEITSADVLGAYSAVMEAAPNMGMTIHQVKEKIREITSGTQPGKDFVKTILERHLSLSE